MRSANGADLYGMHGQYDDGHTVTLEQFRRLRAAPVPVPVSARPRLAVGQRRCPRCWGPVPLRSADGHLRRGRTFCSDACRLNRPVPEGA